MFNEKTGATMKKLLLLCALTLPFSAFAADVKPAPTRTAEIIRSTLADMNIKSINKTPIPGLFELQVAGQILYSDKTGRHIVNGHMFDTMKKQDLTSIRLAEINRIDWSKLPLDKAIVSGPKGGVKMAVFTDPDCPYCKRLENTLKDIKGLRVYTFLFPLTQLHPDSYAKAESIWCAKDQHQAMVDVMLTGKTLPKATCKTPLPELQALAKQLNVQGTPTIFSADGRKYAGSVPLDQIKTWLEQSK